MLRQCALTPWTDWLPSRLASFVPALTKFLEHASNSRLIAQRKTKANSCLNSTSAKPGLTYLFEVPAFYHLVCSISFVGEMIGIANFFNERTIRSIRQHSPSIIGIVSLDMSVRAIIILLLRQARVLSDDSSADLLTTLPRDHDDSNDQTLSMASPTDILCPSCVGIRAL